MACALVLPATSRAVEWSRGARLQDWLESLTETRAHTPLTPSQLALRSKLEADLAGDLPTHRLRLRNKRSIEGQIVSETSTGIRIRESDGYSGFIVSVIPRTEIVAVEKIPVPHANVTDDDIRLAWTFPKFHLVKVGIYSLVTDAPFSDATRVLDELAKLREEFVRHFTGLILPQCEPKNIQVVYFNHEEDYQGYVAWAAPGLENSSGFYSTSEDRLAFLDRFGSSGYVMGQQFIRFRQRQIANARFLDAETRVEVGAQLAEVQAQVMGRARSDTRHVVRHEGAHQLFQSYGIVSLEHVEPMWLIEGLAQYCEPAEIGGRHDTRTEELAQSIRRHELIPMKKLISFRDPSGFFALGEAKVGVAYAQSWALTYFLMQEERRNGFIEFIKHYRDLHSARAADEARKEDVGRTLAKYLHTDFGSLESEWDKFLVKLCPPEADTVKAAVPVPSTRPTQPVRPVKTARPAKR